MNETRRVERQELQIEVLAQREQESKALLALLRQVDLGAVMVALGGRCDVKQGGWLLGVEVISIAGERFHSHARQQGGIGAIALLMQVAEYDYPQAVAWMRDQFGVGVAVVAAARHAMQIAAMEPSPEPRRWCEADQPKQPTTLRLRQRKRDRHELQEA